jgi:uncharacterized protein YbjT (DUF2867 family)
MTNNTTLVLGGTGKTGRRVVERLRTAGVPVRVGSRSGQPRFDWNDPATWLPVLRGADVAYLAYYPDLAVPGAERVIGALAEQAVASGVRRLVLLSGRGEEGAEHCERLVRDAGAEWTILRSSWMCQNFSESYLLEPVLAGEVALPAGSVPEPFVDADDIADVAAAALTDGRHAGQLYELTGPRSLTFEEAVAEIAEASGRPVGFLRITQDEYDAALAAEGLSPDERALVRYLFTTVLDGRNARPADGVQRALGRQPRDFTDYARAAAATGVWDAAA